MSSANPTPKNPAARCPSCRNAIAIDSVETIGTVTCTHCGHAFGVLAFPTRTLVVDHTLIALLCQWQQDSLDVVECVMELEEEHALDPEEREMLTTAMVRP